MSEAARDKRRFMSAAERIVDGRHPTPDRGEIMLTLEGAVAAVLLYVMGGNHRAAAAMLNEGLVQGVEARIALAAACHADRSEGG